MGVRSYTSRSVSGKTDPAATPPPGCRRSTRAGPEQDEDALPVAPDPGRVGVHASAHVKCLAHLSDHVAERESSDGGLCRRPARPPPLVDALGDHDGQHVAQVGLEVDPGRLAGGAGAQGEVGHPVAGQDAQAELVAEEVTRRTAAPGLRHSSSGAPTWTMRPSRISTMRSPSRTASSMSCVTKTTVLPRRLMQGRELASAAARD